MGHRKCSCMYDCLCSHLERARMFFWSIGLACSDTCKNTGAQARHNGFECWVSWPCFRFVNSWAQKWVVGYQVFVGSDIDPIVCISIQYLCVAITHVRAWKRALCQKDASIQSIVTMGMSRLPWVILHRESFKGHISRLAQPKTQRSHCRLDEDNPEHKKLLSDPRFGDAANDWDSAALSFGQQFYDTVKSASTSSRTSASSHSAVSDDLVM